MAHTMHLANLYFLLEKVKQKVIRNVLMTKILPPKISSKIGSKVHIDYIKPTGDVDKFWYRFSISSN